MCTSFPRGCCRTFKIHPWWVSDTVVLSLVDKGKWRYFILELAGCLPQPCLGKGFLSISLPSGTMAS